MEYIAVKRNRYYKIKLQGVAAQYVVTHPQPSHNINNLSFFALKREFLSFEPSRLIQNHA